MCHDMLMYDADVRDLWAIWSSEADTTVSMPTCVADCSGSVMLTCGTTACRTKMYNIVQGLKQGNTRHSVCGVRGHI